MSHRLVDIESLKEELEKVKADVTAARKPRPQLPNDQRALQNLNTNTLAGQVPPRANLGDMSGLVNGLAGDRNGGAMIDGERFVGPKAYKDAKLCNILTAKEMSNRWHESTGVTFSTMYPGCIADTPLFRNHTPVFRFLFPLIQKYVTKGYVSQAEAGGRLASVVCDPDYTESGA